VNRATWTYLGQLTRALQAQGVDGRRAGEFVAEVESHLAETGSDPVDEFGTPYALASDLAGRPGARRPGWIPPLWWLWALGLVALTISVTAIDLLIAGTIDGAVPIRARSVLYASGIYVGGLVGGYIVTRRLDGRSWHPLAGLAAAVIIAASASTLSQLAGEAVITTMPSVWLWTLAIVVAPALLVIVARRNNPVRFPPHARHLRRLNRGPFAGSPPADPAAPG